MTTLRPFAKKFTTEFKKEVLKYLIDNNLNFHETSLHFNINYQTAKNWYKQHQDPTGKERKKRTVYYFKCPHCDIIFENHSNDHIEKNHPNEKPWSEYSQTEKDELKITQDEVLRLGLQTEWDIIRQKTTVDSFKKKRNNMKKRLLKRLEFIDETIKKYNDEKSSILDVLNKI
jgi:transposase-like protein